MSGLQSKVGVVHNGAKHCAKNIAQHLVSNALHLPSESLISFGIPADTCGRRTGACESHEEQLLLGVIELVSVLCGFHFPS